MDTEAGSINAVRPTYFTGEFFVEMELSLTSW